MARETAAQKKARMAAQRAAAAERRSLIPSQERIEDMHAAATPHIRHAADVIKATQLRYAPLALTRAAAAADAADGSSGAKLVQNTRAWSVFMAHAKDALANGGELQPDGTRAPLEYTADGALILDVAPLILSNPIAYSALCLLGDKRAAIRHAHLISVSADTTFAEVYAVSQVWNPVYTFWQHARRLTELDAAAEQAKDRYNTSSGAVSFDRIMAERAALAQAEQIAAERKAAAEQAAAAAAERKAAAELARAEAQQAAEQAQQAQQAVEQADETERAAAERKARAAAEKAERKARAAEQAEQAAEQAAADVKQAIAFAERAAAERIRAAIRPIYSAMPEKTRKAFDRAADAAAAADAEQAAADAAWLVIHPAVQQAAE